MREAFITEHQEVAVTADLCATIEQIAERTRRVLPHARRTAGDVNDLDLEASAGRAEQLVDLLYRACHCSIV